MKKDSFTFSDKLKKSKSLPLSKRIPSRTGGDVKAKRTLFERAQRDLPFIIVAALALLLLPFLSRESVEIDTPSVVWGDGDSYLEDFNQPKSAEGEIALSSFRNPLDLIIRHGDKDSSARDSIDTYGSGSEESSAGSDYSARSSYSSEDYSSAPATSSYGKTVRRSVRNSINRIPTAIGSLRAGSMVSPGAGSGVGHSMAIGSRSKDAAPKVQGPGVRPVALQPLVASGKGRDLTGGDALYAEAARSIGAMNRPGAKQALLDAQLADVDGKPLGDTKGGPGAGDPNRPGAGGGPSNSWSHNNQKPWWWDMMSDRAQKRWMLWHYNWEKMASDSLIKLTSGLASCLITGSNNFEVGKFLGSPGGGSDYECFDYSGKIIEAAGARSDYIDGIATTTKTKDGGSETHVSPEIALAYENYCASFGGRVQKTQAPRKSALDVRLRCLGMKLSELKNKTQVKRNIICEGVTSDPMSINITTTRNGKNKPNKLKTMGFYVVGNVAGGQKTARRAAQEKNSPQPSNTLPWYAQNDVSTPDETTPAEKKEACVIYIHEAEFGKNEIPDYVAKRASKIVVYQVGGHATGFYPEDPINHKVTKKGNWKFTDDVYNPSEEYYRVLRGAEQKIKNAIEKGACLTEKEAQEILKPIGEWKENNTARRVNEIAICNVPNRFSGTLYRPVSLAPVDSHWDSNVKLEACNEHNEVFITAVPSSHKFQTTITNPGKRTIAFVVEKVQNGPLDGEYFGESSTSSSKSIGDRTKWRVVKKIDYTQNTHLVFPDQPQKGQTTFKGDVEIGRSYSVKDDNKDGDKQARPGEGRIIWVTTDNMDFEGAREGDPVDAPTASAVFNFASKKYAICQYRWGCDTGSVCNANAGVRKICYKEEKGKKVFYQAVVTQEGYYLSTGSVIDSVVDQTGIYACMDICIHKRNPLEYGIRSNGQDLATIPASQMDPSVYIANCTDCNKANDEDPNQEYCNHTDGQAYPCKFIDNAYIRTSKTPVGEAVDSYPDCTPICAKKAAALGINQPTKLEDIEQIETTDDNPRALNPKNDVIGALEKGLRSLEDSEDSLCPFCNPPADTKRKSAQPADGDDGGDSCPLAPGKVTKDGPCQVTISGEFFTNASYTVCKVAELKQELAWVYDYMEGCKDPILEGHASKIYETGDEENNMRISFDRALEVSKYVRTIWEEKGEKVSIDKDSHPIAGNYDGGSTGTPGKSWPGHRNSISRAVRSNATITFTITGVGSALAPERRPTNWKELIADPDNGITEQYYRDLEIPDRKVILKGTPEN